MKMRWETVIGLEVHAELSTKTKLFCRCPAIFGKEPNTQCCEICTGMPGTLPVLNAQAVEYAVRAALALNGRLTPVMQFDRKHYFYPDLPKAWQTSMLWSPICRDGFLEIPTENTVKKKIRIHELHLEEDAGKLFHNIPEGTTQIDYNRCGIPLIEIVTEPDFRNPEEVTEFLTQLRILLPAIGISDGKMQEGSLRADVNLSVRPYGTNTLGTRTEMKNLNSLKAIRRAIETEQLRQIQQLEQGRVIQQETRRWDDTQGKSFPLRSKETAQDYRYFPEPDLPCIILDKETIAAIRRSMPELPHARQERFQSAYNLDKKQAQAISVSPYLSALFETTTAICGDPQETVHWLLGPVSMLLNARSMDWKTFDFSPEQLAELITLVISKKVNRQTAVQVLEGIWGTNTSPKDFIHSHKLGLITDETLIHQTIKEVIETNPKSVADYLAGKENALKFLMGRCMRILGGQGDPFIIKNKLAESLQAISQKEK